MALFRSRHSPRDRNSSVAQHGCTSQRVTKHVGARLGQPLAGGRTAPRPGHGLCSNVLLNACPRETNLSSPGRTHLAPGACTPHRSRLAGHRSSLRPSVRAKRSAHQCRMLQRMHAHNREQSAQSSAVHVISRLRALTSSAPQFVALPCPWRSLASLQT